MSPAAMQMPSRGGLLIRLGVSFVVAAVIVFCAVLPAEYHRDPTGVGKLTGLMAMSQPAPVDAPADSKLAAVTAAGAPARSYQLPFRSDEVTIPMKPDGELEYKVKMQPGGTLVYSWAADHGTVYYDFHGEKPYGPRSCAELRDRNIRPGQRISDRAVCGHSRMVPAESGRYSDRRNSENERILRAPRPKRKRIRDMRR